MDIEFNLVHIFNWLEDKIAQTHNEKEKATKQKLLQQCEQLIARGERIKKNITDDMEACRYAEGKTPLDPIVIGGFLVGTPVGMATLAKTFISDKPDAITLHAGEAGAALGILLAFHRQAGNLCKLTMKAAAASPEKLRNFRKAVRTSLFNATLAASVATKDINEIELHNQARVTRGATTVINATYG